MTWKELAEKIQEMDEDQQDTDVTVCNGPPDSSRTEYWKVEDFGATGEEDDILDAFHPILIFDA